MSSPNVWGWIKDDAAVQAALGDPPRVYEDEAEVMDAPEGQPVDAGAYATWHVMTGAPGNKLSEAPRDTRFVLVFSVVSGTQASRDAAKKALIDALELGHGYVVRENPSYRDESTKLYVCGFDFSCWTPRAP